MLAYSPLVRVTRTLLFAAVTAAAGAGLAAAAPVANTERPRVKALPSTAQVGKPVRLLALASDDSGAFSLGGSVFRGTTNLLSVRSDYIRQIKRPLHYYVQFSQPKLARGTYRFCVRAFDRAGHRSGISCSTLRVR
jgi:hypothetical protein